MVDLSIDMNKVIKKLKKSNSNRDESEEGKGDGENVKYVMPPKGGAVGYREDQSSQGDGSEKGEVKNESERKKIGLVRDKQPGEWVNSGSLIQDESEDDRDIDISYPVIPNNPGKNDRVFASVHISYDEEDESLVYRVSEPELSERGRNVLNQIEEILKESLDVRFDQLKKEEAKEYMKERVRKILRKRNFGLSREQEEVIEYYAYRNFVGLGKLEPIMNDKRVEDISCDGVNIPVYIYHRNPEVSSVKSNVIWETDDELDSFVRKLSQRCDKTISMANPLLDGALPDGSRVQATLGTDIARRGTNFTIRRFTDEPLTPVHLMESGSLTPRMLAYLWICVENGKSVLISGATASGKTTLLNALSLFVRPELKIVSIEDTPELRLPHPNWIPEVSRSGFGSGESSKGEVTLDDLLEESLRQRPDYIIVGEVRGEEAYILFQQIATGHPGMATIHASNIQKVMDRLTTKPIELPPSLIENLDLIVFPKRTRRQGTYLRRVGSVYEFEKYDKELERPVVNRVFEWIAKDDSFENENASFLLHDIVEDHGIEVEAIQEELLRRKKVLQWMYEQDIKHYQDVGRILSKFYNSPKEVLEMVEEDGIEDDGVFDEGEDDWYGDEDSEDPFDQFS